jgi:transposase
MLSILNSNGDGNVDKCNMNWIEGDCREQAFILPPCLDEYVDGDNPVRFLDAFVEQLDLRQLGLEFPKENAEGRGRPAYHPKCLLKLYLYGYLNQVRSSRRLEGECARNLEVIWLMRNLKPDHKTIADFRKDNAAAFKQVVREFSRLCRQMELFGGQLLAIDGTRIKGQNAPDQNWSQSKLQKQLREVDARLEQYIKSLDQADEQEGPAPVNRPSAEQLKEKIARLRQRRGDIEQRLSDLKQSGQTQVSVTDPDSRSMKTKGGHVVGYNVQGAVDAKHHLLAVTEVNNLPTDQGQLGTVAKAAKAELQIEKADVAADGGYFKHQDVKDCQDIGLEPHLPTVENSSSEREGRYGKADFTYDAQQNCYRCPAGAELKLHRKQEDKGRIVYQYQNRQACNRCPIKQRCTGSKYRTVSRWEHEPCVERMIQQVQRSPEKLAARKTLIEHCWGTLKWLLPGGFLLRGLKKVQAEVSLAHFGYNLKRVLAVVGLEKLLQALRKLDKNSQLTAQLRNLAVNLLPTSSENRAALEIFLYSLHYTNPHWPPY